MGFDVLIRGATVYPGDRPPLRADVGVKGGRIEAVEPELAGAVAGGGRGRRAGSDPRFEGGPGRRSRPTPRGFGSR